MYLNFHVSDLPLVSWESRHLPASSADWRSWALWQPALPGEQHLYNITKYDNAWVIQIYSLLCPLIQESTLNFSIIFLICRREFCQMVSTCSHSSLCCLTSPRALDWKPPSRIFSFFSSFAAFRASAVMWALFTWAERDTSDETKVSSITWWGNHTLWLSSTGYLLGFADLEFFLKAFDAVFFWS